MTASAKLQQPGIATHFIQVLMARAQDKGVPVERLLAAARLNDMSLAEGRLRVSPDQLGSLMRLVWRELDDELMGFGAGVHRFGCFALMARQMVDCGTLGEALRYSFRFYNLISPALRWHLVEEGEHCVLSIELLAPEQDDDHLLEEFILLMWHRFCNWLIGEKIPLVETVLRFAKPAHSAEYRLMFPGTVRYGSKLSSITVDCRCLSSAIVRSRRDFNCYLPQLPNEWFVKQVFDGSVSGRVLQEMEEYSAALTLEELAERWCISSRTLHRHLQQEGSSFRRIQEQFRREKAESLLLEGHRSIGSVAQALAMTEPAFSRAFKHWTGISPLAYRRTRKY